MTPKKLETYEQLIQSLEGLVKVYRTLLAVVRKEREILVSSDLDELNENNRTKEKLLLGIRKMEDERIQITKQVFESEGLQDPNMRLLDLAIHFGGEYEARIRSVHSVLELLLKRVKDFNKQNEVLISSALENITGAMNSIRDSLQDNKTYQRKGEVAAKSSEAGRLVSREV